MSKKLKKLGKAAAIAGAAYLASKTMAPKEKKGYLSKFTKIDYKGGDKNPNMPGFLKNILTKLIL
jgi:hypothetical protein